MDQKTSSTGSEHPDSALRIVLIGYNESGKSSSGNTILGSDEFDLKKNAECVKKERVVTGRQISVIDTPGRHRSYRSNETPKLYKEEVVSSVTLCPPGPHALLLNINTQIQFKEASKDAVMEHLQLFGETVWKHIIVLFTHGDQLEHDIQQYIKDEGEPLQCILEKCGNRFHVFNHEAKGGSTQVAELLKKIDEMVAENHGRHFELDEEKLSLLAQKKRVYEELKRKKEQQCRENLEVRTANEHKLTELRIVLLGRESAGKTSTADTILNSQSESSTEPALVSTSREATIGRWQVTVIDTPGWLTNDPSQTPSYIRQEIVHSVSVCSPGPHAFLLVIPANITFTEADETAISEHLQLLGEKVWNHSIVLFTCADWMGDSPIELYIESEGEPLSRIIKKCRNRYHAISNTSQDQSQVEALLEKIELMVAGDSNCFYEMDEQTQKNIADEGHKDEDKNTDTTFQLPIGDSKEGPTTRKRKSISSSGYGMASSSECGSEDGKRPVFSL